jgi:hypothetical protein
MKDNDVLTSNQSAEPGHSLIFTLHKNRSYILGTMALTWSSLYTEDATNYAWLIMLQRSGHIVIWKAETPFTNISFSTYHDLHLVDPSILKAHPGSSGMIKQNKHCIDKDEIFYYFIENQLLLFVGSHRGQVKCWTLSWDRENAPTCDLLGTIIPDEDHIPVSAIEVLNSSGFLVVCVAKNNAVVAVSVKYDRNGLECVDTKFVLLPGVQLAGIRRNYFNSRNEE